MERPKCPQCGFKITTPGIIRCPRCYKLLLTSCDGNCSNCKKSSKCLS